MNIEVEVILVNKDFGRITLPTDVDVVEDTLALIKELRADAIRDCDGTHMPPELEALDIKRYATYYTTRKDNRWASEHPEEIQQMYVMSRFYTATDTVLEIPLMQHLYPDQFKVNDMDDIKRWWEVIDRTTGEVIDTNVWTYDAKRQVVRIQACKPFHAYTVSFLVFIVWDPVHMYNSLTNEWEDGDKQMTYDVRQPLTKVYAINKFKQYLQDHPNVDVVRFTTFFHQFTLVFDECARETFVDWFGYSASVSPYILERFETSVGYPFRPEYIINQGFHNSTFVVPTKQFKDFIDFQQREVSELMKVFIDLTHQANKEAMMFLGDHWIGTEPYGKYFKHLGMDAVVGSVGNGMTMRLIADIPGVRYTEGRLLPYFFPDTFYEGGDPVSEARVNWISARRAILRKPLDRIGYGGYLKLALQFPDFIQYVKEVVDEFRTIYNNVANQTPYTLPFKVYVLNSWGKLRSWGSHMVAHALPYPQNKEYEGVLEALSGMPFDIEFISFDDILNDLHLEPGVILNAGDAYTAFSGGAYWLNSKVIERIREYVYRGNGFVGIGEPSAYLHEGKYFQLYDVLGVEREIGFTLSYDKYNWEAKKHFIMDSLYEKIQTTGKAKFVYALDACDVLQVVDNTVTLAVNQYGKGRAVYMNGLSFSFDNSRLLYRSLCYAAAQESACEQWYAENSYIEVNVYYQTNSYCVVNNSYAIQKSKIYTKTTSFEIELLPGEIRWFSIS